MNHICIPVLSLNYEVFTKSVVVLSSESSLRTHPACDVTRQDLEGKLMVQESGRKLCSVLRYDCIVNESQRRK